MKLTDRDRRAIRWGAVALSLIFVVWLAGHAVSTWRGLRHDIQQARADLAVLSNDDMNRASQQRRLRRIFGPGITEDLPPVHEAKIQFVKDVQQVTSASGVGIASLTPQRVSLVREVPEVAVVAVQVKGACAMPQLANFLAQLQKCEHLMLVEKLNVTKEGDKLSLSMTLFTLAYQEREL